MSRKRVRIKPPKPFDTSFKQRMHRAQQHGKALADAKTVYAQEQHALNRYHRSSLAGVPPERATTADQHLFLFLSHLSYSIGGEDIWWSQTPSPRLFRFTLKAGGRWGTNASIGGGLESAIVSAWEYSYTKDLRFVPPHITIALDMHQETLILRGSLRLHHDPRWFAHGFEGADSIHLTALRGNLYRHSTPDSRAPFTGYGTPVLRSVGMSARFHSVSAVQQMPKPSKRGKRGKR